jgi:DNA (cytosine-5)-methyltransferase 3A
MNVLSIFDGMSCGQIALHELGITPDVYYASEIDKHAIAQTQLNFPDTIQLGSVINVNVSDLKPIDLLIGGSPCQSFSFAGKRKGMSTKRNEEIYTLDRYLQLKAEGFEFEGQSYLFWEYMRILTDIRKYNPNVLFLLENVEMGNKWERVLSEAIGIFGVHINSALVSAQNRKRIYWTNIRARQEGLFWELHSDIPQPEDRGILLRDILETEVDEKYYIKSENMLKFVTDEWRQKKLYVQINGEKAIPQMARQYQSWCGDYINDSFCVSMVGRKLDENGVRKDNDPNIKAIQRLEPNTDGKTNCLTSVQKDNLILHIKSLNNRVKGISFSDEGIRPHQGDNRKSGIQELGIIATENSKTSCLTTNHEPKCILNERQRKNYKQQNEKANTFLSTSWKGSQANGMTLAGNSCIRRLTPTECARLQTVPDWYKWACSDTQQYRMLGNGWTVEVIKHIFSFI